MKCKRGGKTFESLTFTEDEVGRVCGKADVDARGVCRPDSDARARVAAARGVRFAEPTAIVQCTG